MDALPSGSHVAISIPGATSTRGHGRGAGDGRACPQAV